MYTISPTLFLVASLLLGGCALEKESITKATNHHSTLTNSLGGKHTSTTNHSDQAFMQTIKTFSNDEENLFITGKSFFRTPWVTAPSSTTARDGIGPLFSANTCTTCHINNGRGFALDDNQSSGIIPRSLAMRLSISGSDEILGFKEDPNYGHQINRNALFGIPFEAEPWVSYEEIEGSFDDGQRYSLRKPTYSLKSLGYGELHDDTSISVHVSAQLIGLGLIEAINEEDILSSEDALDSDNDGISGRANYVYDREKNSTVLGRFTWKASLPTLKQQVALAFISDIGITTPLFSKESCGENQTQCKEASRDEIDAPNYVLESITYYLKTTAVPTRRDINKNMVQAGYTLFKSIGCVKCHKESFITGSSDIPELENVKIHPFSDYLLHDMGEGLADKRTEFLASGAEWRTPPLWGVGLFKETTGHANYLHDGRARNLQEAILWHGGEAQSIKENFTRMNRSDREALIAFLNSL
jgi:CxxC motif-containing protein (DUF1111 family)